MPPNFDRPREKCYSLAVRVFLNTLGCKLNESEVEAWARQFARDGSELVSDPRDADVCVLNTCAITHIAARKSRQMARQLARANPNAKITLTGCFVDISPGEAKALPNVALVIPNADKDRLVALAGDLPSDTRFQAADGVTSPIPRHASLRTRAFVKIQDGCNMSCAYCIIPLARGKEHSRARTEIVAEVQSLVRAGYKEIILTGVQISAFANNGDKAYGLRDLIAAILAESDVPRLRLTSIAPWDLDESLLDLWRDARLCRHLHLSLQSGSDTVLRRMHRPYTTAQFARAVEIARAKIPDVGITTDVIVGFPGESADEFEQSLHFVEQMQFSRAHIFPYSARAGTPAAAMPRQVPDAVKESRAKQMQAIADASARAFAQKFVGRTMQVLWESANNGEWSGYTDNYIRVVVASDADWRNQFSRVRVTDVTDDGVLEV
jgi:threonylcarbamoyladenosine tRNA methylthiotransferase MtaB